MEEGTMTKKTEMTDGMSFYYTTKTSIDIDCNNK